MTEQEINKELEFFKEHDPETFKELKEEMQRTKTIVGL